MSLTISRSAAGLALLAALAAGCGTAVAAHSSAPKPAASAHQRHHPAPIHTPVTTPPAPPATAPAAPASTPPAPPATAPAKTANPIPQGNGGDHDPDNNGGPSDGDGNI
jgi:hypothetical protein